MNGRLSEAGVDAELARIAEAQREDLLRLWRELHRSPPPKSLSLPFLRAALSYQVQCRVHGGPRPQVLRDLKRLTTSKASAEPQQPGLRQGTQLVREWNGYLYRVNVTDTGFEMDGQAWTSLTAVARHITGAHWSGPRFFGLQTRSVPKATEENPTDESAEGVPA